MSSSEPMGVASLEEHRTVSVGSSVDTCSLTVLVRGSGGAIDMCSLTVLVRGSGGAIDMCSWVGAWLEVNGPQSCCSLVASSVDDINNEKKSITESVSNIGFLPSKTNRYWRAEQMLMIFCIFAMKEDHAK